MRLLREPHRPLQVAEMAPNRLLATGVVGFVVSMLGCVTPASVAVLAAVGVSGSIGWLDYVLLPAMTGFAALAVYAVVCRRRRVKASL